MIKDLKKLKKDLPDNPGVYFFKKGQEILYVGRATSLKDRVISYFRDDLLKNRGMLLVDMISKADKVDFEKTDSVLEAIILESNLIKKYRPYYNTKEKDDKSYNYIVITEEQYPRLIIVRGKNIDSLTYKIRSRFGPYISTNTLRDALKVVRKIFPFRDEKSKDLSHERFYKSIEMIPDDYTNYLYTIKHIEMFFDGRKKDILKELEKKMKLSSKNKEFEKASKIRDKIYALKHIQDVSLIKDDLTKSTESDKYSSLRIEAYDIAHISGTDVVGVMVVLENGQFSKKDYRKFKISQDKNNDIASLTELLNRRFAHKEWKFPDLIVIDGGIAQIGTAQKILEDKNIKIPMVSVVKDDRHKASRVIAQNTDYIELKNDIFKINAEAHRFAVKYHRKLRENIL